MSKQLILTLYSRPGCGLCDDVKEDIEPLLRELGVELEVINIDSSPSLKQRFGHHIPVLELGAAVLAMHRVDVVRLREQLLAAMAGG